MILALTLITVLFVTDNSYFFEMVDKQQKEGYTWQYVGRQNADEFAFSLPTIDQVTGEKIIYWKLTAPEE